MQQTISSKIYATFRIKNFKTTSFDSNEVGHRILLILDIIELFVALKLREILRYLSDLDIKIDRKTLEQYLFICEKLELISVITYSTATYYVGKGANAYIKLAYSKGSQLNDRIPLKTRTLEFYDNSDQKRKKAISMVRSASCI